MKGFRLRNIVALFLFVLLGASVLMAHVWKQNSYVRLSKESVKLERGRKALRDTLALLEMEAGELRNLARIETLAREKFGLEYGNTPVLVYPGEDEAKEGEPAQRHADAVPGKAPQRSVAGWPTRGL